MKTIENQGGHFYDIDRYATATEIEQVLREALELAKKGEGDAQH